MKTGSFLSLELIRYYEFSYVPVELISRLYEEFLGEDTRDVPLGTSV